MRKRVVVIGASGQLGRALFAEFQNKHDVTPTVHRLTAPGQTAIDLAEPESAVEQIRSLRPDWILVAGAFCFVDLCETEQESCLRVNVEGPKAIARYAREQNCRVVYYSTDHVFDGSRPANLEMGPVHPLNFYAQSKWAGEEALREALPDGHLILRTAWLYGMDEAKKNFILRLIMSLSQRQRAMVPMDQWGSPTFTGDLAAVTRFLLEKGRSGTFHATGPDFVNRLELAQQVCLAIGADPHLVQGVTTAELNQKAKRPLKVRLDCRKLQEAGGPPFRSLKQGLEILKERLSAQTA